MVDVEHSAVSAWEETISRPTYTPPPPDRNPMFLEKRVNQGTSGRVYPNPFTDRLSSECQERTYRAVYLENEYLRLMILPEIGGRIQEGRDKTNGYDFVYRQQVIKPALIGLFGSWISGGVEFNWPQHHRPATFLPVHHLIERHADGSATVWLSDHDPLERLKGMVGICLYPGKAFLEMKVQLYNRTPLPQTFLWWVNFAVHVHEQYQVVFPPDVTVVTDHSKRSMSYFPVARGDYYGVDYSQGVDISWYGNIPVPTSYFVWETRRDFFGGYDHRQDAGVIHVANRHIAPGKKMFTWGAGEFGKGWEHNLTDADGPYIELMAGVYTDNQPDFSWLQPYETKTFSQYWYPVQQIGPPVEANRRAALRLSVEDGRARVGLVVTEDMEEATLMLDARGEPVHTGRLDLYPGAPAILHIALPAGTAETDLLVRVYDGQGREVIRYAPQVVEQPPLPEPQRPPLPPETFEIAEELYLTGLHLEQYRHPTIAPEPYWEAALDKDPSDVRCNNALGLSYLRRGCFAQAEDHFRRAIAVWTRRNPNPRDGEPFYNLGLALKGQGRIDQAYDAFYKAIWSYAWQAAGYYALAEIDCRRGDLESALEHLDRSLQVQAMNTKARNLKAAVLRRLDRQEKAAQLVAGTIDLDPLDMWARNEQVLYCRAQGDEAGARQALQDLVERMRVPEPLVEVQSYLDMAFDYTAAGLWAEAVDLLGRLETAFPTVLYALGYCLHRLGRGEEGSALYHRASQAAPDYCFPVRLEELAILEHARSLDPDDGRVSYYLGNLFYDKRRYDEAIACWELAVRAAPGFSIPWRNLGIAMYNVRHDAGQALTCYERALAADPGDGRVLSELDQLLQHTGAPAEERLARLEGRLDLVRSRDDLSVELAALYNRTMQPQKALEYLLSRRFHPWEGGTGRVWQQYVTAHALLALAALDAGQGREALAHLEAARACPDNLGERKHLHWPDAHLDYLSGLAYGALGDPGQAAACFERVLSAEAGLSELAYYQALALRQLGREEEAIARLKGMLDGAREQLERDAQQGFATSVPEFVFVEEDLETRLKTHYTYLIGLAHLGLDRRTEARNAFRTVLERDPSHLDAEIQLHRMDAEASGAE